MGQNYSSYSLQAFTNEEDFIPTIYFVGQIKANGDFVGIKLNEVVKTENKPDTLDLRKLVPDNYDPNGSKHLQITPFHKIPLSVWQYRFVVIESQYGNLNLVIEKLERGKTYLGGGSEAPRG